MPCVPCVEKMTKRYLAHGLNPKQAKFMAEKLVRRVEKRQAQERKKYGKKAQFFNNFRRWVLRTNWKATFFWSFHLHRILWIGQGINGKDDYLLECSQGTCLPRYDTCEKIGMWCDWAWDCSGGSCSQTGSCGCPPPLPNSSEVTPCPETCTGYGDCQRCNLLFNFCNPACFVYPCNYGDCGYDCIPPAVWNGVACVVPVVGGVLAQIM